MFSEHHLSQFISVKKEKLNFKKQNIYVRDYSKFSSASFREDVSLQNFNHRHNSIDDQFNDFFWRLDGCVDRHAPVKKLKPKEVKLKTKPWINDQIMKMIKIRNKLFARKKRQPNNANITKLYSLFRNRINREIKQSKKIYYNNYFNKYSSDMKKMWKGIRSIVNIKQSTAPQITQLNINGKLVNDPVDIAERVNEFFCKYWS